MKRAIKKPLTAGLFAAMVSETRNPGSYQGIPTDLTRAVACTLHAQGYPFGCEVF
jgi:hypothetical protein